MLRWIFSMESKSLDIPSETQSARDDRKALSYGENYLFIDLVVAEVEIAVVKFELEKEKEQEEERKSRKGPDYSWLIASRVAKPKKYLTTQEKQRVENACDRLKPSEWSKTIDNWKSNIQKPESREQIIEQFVLATHGTIQSRKHEPTITEAIKKYATGRASSMRSIQHADMPLPNSARSVNQLSFIELQEIV